MTQNLEVETPGSIQLTEQPAPAEDQEPKSENEKYLASLWAEIIHLEQVSLSDKFLEVGGNSLTLNIILNRIEIETGVALEPQLFFDEERSSLSEIAKDLEAARAGNPNRSRETMPAFRCNS